MLPSQFQEQKSTVGAAFLVAACIPPCCPTAERPTHNVPPATSPSPSLLQDARMQAELRVKLDMARFLHEVRQTRVTSHIMHVCALLPSCLSLSSRPCARLSVRWPCSARTTRRTSPTMKSFQSFCKRCRRGRGAAACLPQPPRSCVSSFDTRALRPTLRRPFPRTARPIMCPRQTF